MGGTLPALARAVSGADDPARRRIGVLYGWNTLGAVAGTVAADPPAGAAGAAGGWAGGAGGACWERAAWLA